MLSSYVLSNPNYRARTYVGWTQFKAAYIFQSGDHMGGTLDFKCEKTF